MAECEASMRRPALVLEMAVTAHPGYKDFVWAIQLNRFGLRLVGLWPEIEETAENGFATVAIFHVIMNLISLVPLVCALMRIWGDMILMIDNLQITLTFIVTSLKLIVMQWKRKVVASIVTMMLKDWMESKADSERHVMVRRAHIARLFVIFGYTLMTMGFLVVIILPSFGLPLRHFTNLTDRGRMLPLQAYYFYDTGKSPQFELTFLLQAASIFFDVVIYSSVDAFLGLAILHVCGQLENFRHRLASLVLSDDFESVLRKNVEAHRRLIRFASNIEDVFSVVMLGLVFYFGIVFCLCTFVFLSIFTGDYNIPLSGKAFGVVGTISLFAHTFLYCGAGEIITEQAILLLCTYVKCEAVHRAIYDLDWYKLEPRRARCLMLLMIRAKEPFRITAGKVLPLTMTTFCSLLKSSAGYISFLLTLRS